MIRKKIYLLLLLIPLLHGCKESDFNDLLDRQGDQRKELQELTDLCKKLNEDIYNLQVIVNTDRIGDNITHIEELADGAGYTISFSKSAPITIRNGKKGDTGPDGDAGKDGIDGTDGKDGVDGKDAVAPVIGIKEEEGVYYWTIDGEFVLNNGQKVPVTGKDGLTPQFKIQDGKWYVSFDGNTWDAVPVTGTEKPELVMSETDDEYVFTLGETTIRIAKEHAFMIKVTSDVQKVTPSEVVSFGYTVTGADATTHVIIEANGVEAQLDEEKSLVTVTVPSVIEDNSYVMVKAIRNSDGKYSAQYITIKLNQYGTFGGVIVVDEDEYLNW